MVRERMATEIKTRYELKLPIAMMVRIRDLAGRKEVSAAWVMRRALEAYLEANSTPEQKQSST